MICARGVRKSYRHGREVLRGVDLEVAEGQLVCVVGRSGSGKTSLLNIVGGLDSVYRGTVRVMNRDLAELGDAELSQLRNSTFGFLFQEYHLLEQVTAAENVALAALFSRGRGSVDRGSVRQRAVEVLELVGLGDRAGDRPVELSGGERQRLALARALFHRPRLLLCDEPTGNLDAKTGSAVVGLLHRCHVEEGITVLVTTHDDAISSIADRVLRLQNGLLEEA
jgi:ABC-type lipoprotein export system ATPase subunit